MRISTKGRYSLIALLYMALLEKGVYASTREIASKTAISEGYLEQLFIPLRKSGIIQGVRGSQGGYYIERPLNEISVGSILRSVEGTLAPTECVDSKHCPSEASCLSRHTWKSLYKGIIDCVNAISLQDLVAYYNTDKDPEYAI
ncbi:MAG: Rrf2 family transcriptional regulator [Spirochaetaceae bacterium]|jgi:Rrf2 family protein|nr:Rrf2 family transcriptional regulator [Spirochaetaceae bacterium]